MEVNGSFNVYTERRILLPLILLGCTETGSQQGDYTTELVGCKAKGPVETGPLFDSEYSDHLSKNNFDAVHWFLG